MNLTRFTRHLGFSILCTMVVAILAVSISEVHSFDVFWQLQSGKYMSQTHSFIRTDLFTLMKDVPRSEHTWLHSLFLYATYLLGGYAAISVLKGALVTATLGVLVWTARSRGASFSAISLMVPAFLLTSGGWLERPQLWTLLCFAIFVCSLESFLRERSWQILWLMPLAVFWGNAHAGAVLAVAILCAYLVGESAQAIWEKRFRRAGIPKLVALFVGVFVAGIINPYPSLLLSSLLGANNMGASFVHAKNMDWTTTTFQQEPLFFYAVGVASVVVLLGWRKIRLSDLCLMVGLAIMGMNLVRHIPFFYMGLLAICPAYLDVAVKPLQKRMSKPFASIGSVAVLCVASGLFVWLYLPTYNVYGAFNTGLRSWHYPIEATEFVKRHKLPKNIYNTYDWGGYMAFKLYPDYLMFWDGRQNSAEMFKIGWNAMAGQPDWQRTFDKFEVKTIVTRASTIDTGQKYPLLDRLRASPDWALIFTAESSMVFVRSDSVSAHWLKRYEKPKERMDDTILSEAHLMVNVNPGRYMAWWEMAQIYTKRKEYKNALLALNQHIMRSPQHRPVAERLKVQLVQALKLSGR